MLSSQIIAEAVAFVETARAARESARDTLLLLTDRKRLRDCGREPYGALGSEAGSVGVRVTETDAGRSVGFCGLETCGSVWTCPVCSAKIASGRQTEIAGALTEWVRRGGSVWMLTLTMRHYRGQSLCDLWDGVSAGWAAARSGRAYRAAAAEYGTMTDRVIKTGKRAGEVVSEWRMPFIRVVEVTVGGAFGWHVHVHALMLLAGDVDDVGAAKVLEVMRSGWGMKLAELGLGSVVDEGQDIRRMRASSEHGIADYVTKALFGGLAAEVARGDLKQARGGNVTPFQLLGRIHVDVKAGRAIAPKDRALWEEWEAASWGRRQIQWSVGLRDLLTLEVELTDEELAALEMQGETVAWIEPRDWRAIVQGGGRLVVLAAFTRSDAEGLAVLEAVRARGPAAFLRTVDGSLCRLAA